MSANLLVGKKCMKKWTSEEVRILSMLWPTEGTRRTAAILNRHYPGVERKAKRLGLMCDRPMRNRRQAETLMNGCTSCDADYFSREWHPRMAYILGYIYADGNIGKNLCSLNFLCQRRDEYLLAEIKKELGSSHKIYHREADLRSGPASGFSVSSKKVVMSLVNRFGLCPRKSYVNDLAIPENIPDQFFGDFLRGYFDGDGHIGKRKKCAGGSFSLIGTRRIMKQIRARLVQLASVRLSKLQRCGIVFVVEWGHHEDIKAIHRLMYSDTDCLCLHRKKVVFDDVASQCVQKKGPPH